MDWKLLEAKIIAAVTKVAQQHYQVNEERWLTAEQLSEYVGVFTKRWLQDHGDMLPRQQPTWMDKNGVEHSTSYLYPLHQIQAMIADGRIKNLKAQNIG